ncbi:MAG: hypothetical protein V4629_04545 [Pseudomonadota bacterium]
MKKRFLIFNIITWAVVIGLLELVSFVIIKAKLGGDFDLAVQGGTTMIDSRYQVWQHPENYKSWSGKTNFNNFGFRHSKDLEVKPADNTVRIFFMGGSAAFGSQAMPGSEFLHISGQGEYDNSETITAHLEKKLSATYPQKKFEVINAATNWTRLHQQNLHYLRKIQSLHPDLIISMDGYNDANPIHSLNTWEDTEAIFESELIGNLKHKIRGLFQNSNTAYLAAMLIFRSGESPGVDNERIEKYKKIKLPENFEEELAAYSEKHKVEIEKSVSEYMKSIQYFHSDLQIDNVPNLFLLQPMTILDTAKKMTDREQALLGYMYSRMEHQWFKIAFFRALEKRLVDWSTKTQANFSTMHDVFKNTDGTIDAYSDYCHFTPKGNEQIADFLMQQIAQRYPTLL